MSKPSNNNSSPFEPKEQLKEIIIQIEGVEELEPESKCIIIGCGNTGKGEPWLCTDCEKKNNNARKNEGKYDDE
jgi:hypothetical protein